MRGMTDSLPPIYSGSTPAQVAADLADLLDFQAEGLDLDELRAPTAPPPAL